MSELKLPKTFMDKYGNQEHVVTVFGIDTRDMSKEEILACLTMYMKQDEQRRRLEKDFSFWSFR